MKKIVNTSILITLLFFAGASFVANAQCKNFAKKICKGELGAFTHDGNYHAAILTEGEEAELYKTFYSDQEYRLAICGNNNLPPIEFKILDSNKNVLYSNKDHDYSKTWDFNLESSQQLKLVVKVTSFEQVSDTPASGCVAILFGFKIK
ncbi:MAG: hypothetical protein V2I37_11640 [Marinilabiliaceae bacterium]|jgi:hypothetical protein|nr:hypothetical protein [Marinilabiliaceae bacterium]